MRRDAPFPCHLIILKLDLCYANLHLFCLTNLSPKFYGYFYFFVLLISTTLFKVNFYQGNLLWIYLIKSSMTKENQIRTQIGTRVWNHLILIYLGLQPCQVCSFAFYCTFIYKRGQLRVIGLNLLSIVNWLTTQSSIYSTSVHHCEPYAEGCSIQAPIYIAVG